MDHIIGGSIALLLLGNLPSTIAHAIKQCPPIAALWLSARRAGSQHTCTRNYTIAPGDLEFIVVIGIPRAVLKHVALGAAVGEEL
jgi:hypothetical protein